MAAVVGGRTVEVAGILLGEVVFLVAYHGVEWWRWSGLQA